MDAYWRASNYLSVGQIYLLDNPLLQEPLKREHIKPRLLGHWGTSPGLNMLYVHLNRVIKRDDLNVIYIIGPGHGGPSLVAHAYLEGTYSEVYPNISQDAEGMKRLFKQFSFPGGIPSHVAPETPGSIHEGGELGYALSHAYGAAFDNPDLIVACVVGDGEAETGPLATGWHGNKFLNPARDGAVLPILHLNGYKIANPCFLARIPKDELQKFFEGMGYTPYFVEGHDPQAVHQQLADVLDTVTAEIKQIWADARTNGVVKRPAWPMIVFRTPKGWTCPADHRRQEVRGLLAQPPGADGRHGQARAHQDPRRVDEELPARGAVRRAWDAQARAGRAGADRPPPHERQPARQRRPAAQGPEDARLPRLRRRCPQPGGDHGRVHPRDGQVPPRHHEAEPGEQELPPVQPGREQLQPLAGRAGGDQPLLHGRHLPRRRQAQPRRPGDGGAQRTPVPGLAGGLPADRPARLLQLLRGVHPHHRLDVQPARQVVQGVQTHPVASADRLVQLPAQLARLAAGPQRLQPPGSRLPRPRGQQEGGGHPHLPAAGRQHAAVGDRPLPAQPQLRQRRGGRQATGPAVADDGPGRQALHRRPRHLALGVERLRRASRTSSWPAAATCRPWRPWRRSSCCGSTCPS